MKTYVGFRLNEHTFVHVWEDGPAGRKKYKLEPPHANDGQVVMMFDWGVDTPGAGALAYALLQDLIKDSPSLLLVERFRQEVLACLDHTGNFVLTAGATRPMFDLEQWVIRSRAREFKPSPVTTEEDEMYLLGG